MKKFTLAIIILATISCQQDKIGYVDNIGLMDGYQEKVDVENKFKSRAELMNKKRDSISQAFQLEYQALQTKAQSWSQKKAQEELGLLQQRSQFLGQQLQQEEQQLQSEGQTEMDSVVSKVKKEIQAYGKANGYTYILTGGEGGSVLYGTEAKDLTSELLKILNDKYKE
ncbi:MAG: OmpH family outer membrane protein [Bacteroidota bacterium]